MSAPSPVGCLVTTRRLGPLRAARCWFPRSLEEVRPLLVAHDLVTVVQCPDALADELAPWVFSDRPDVTSIVDLRLPLEELWARLGKTCRYEIRRAEALEHRVLANERTDQARVLLDDAIRRKRWRAPLGDGEWRRLLEYADVFLAVHAGAPAVAHVVVRGGRRAQLRLSATAEAPDRPTRVALGCLNRRLHWLELERYRSEGFEEYDFGGVVLDPAHHLYGIGWFKRSFGGDLVVERFLRLARNPLVRALLRRAYDRDALSPTMNAAESLRRSGEGGSGRAAKG